MASPTDILSLAFERASAHIGSPDVIEDPGILARVEAVCRSSNRSGARFLLAGLLAKVDRPAVDIRKPYTEIGDEDTYSGRFYDEKFIAPFITEHELPCNSTTAFLTPAWRNRNITLTPELELEGSPRQMYKDVLQLLDDVYARTVYAEDLLTEVIRCLLVYRNERQQRLGVILEDLRTAGEVPALSAETIITLIQQHLISPHASRLPVLVVAAAYQAAEKHLGERGSPLQGHNAADEQTGALDDLEITLIDDDQVITSYEMKTRKVTKGDLDRAMQKIAETGQRVDNYIFITTDVISEEVEDYAKTFYDKTGGIEVVILDCISFLRHFLHLFHPLRMQFLDAYQALLLAEPESAVRQELKEAFIALRAAAESGQ